jgi:hypothetical protein
VVVGRWRGDHRKGRIVDDMERRRMDKSVDGVVCSKVST